MCEDELCRDEVTWAPDSTSEAVKFCVDRISWSVMFGKTQLPSHMPTTIAACCFGAFFTQNKVRSRTDLHSCRKCKMAAPRTVELLNPKEFQFESARMWIVCFSPPLGRMTLFSEKVLIIHHTKGHQSFSLFGEVQIWPWTALPWHPRVLSWDSIRLDVGNLYFLAVMWCNQAHQPANYVFRQKLCQINHNSWFNRHILFMLSFKVLTAPKICIRPILAQQLKFRSEAVIQGIG